MKGRIKQGYPSVECGIELDSAKQERRRETSQMKGKLRDTVEGRLVGKLLPCVKKIVLQPAHEMYKHIFAYCFFFVS